MSLICSILRGQLSKLDAIFFYQKWHVDPFSFYSSIIIIIIIIIITSFLIKEPTITFKYLKTRKGGNKHTVGVVSL